MNSETSVEGLIQKAYDSLKASNAVLAHEALMEALRLDYENPEVMYALKCLNWWLDRMKKLDDFHNVYDKGLFIISQWKSYYGFLERIGEEYDPCQYAVRRFVFTRALAFFEEMLVDGVNQNDPALLFQVGRCNKGVGNYEESLRYFEQAGKFRDSSLVLAEQADINALLGETRIAKALFREAFFIDAQGIDLRSLESEMIVRLRKKIQEQGFSGPELTEWMPVFGCLWGVFSIKRKLKMVEVGRLKQSIISLENEIQSHAGESPLLKPRLINRYFWLIDQIENTREDPGLVEETMMKIRILDPVIYKLYRN
jgi:hypothetical protein